MLGHHPITQARLEAVLKLTESVCGYLKMCIEHVNIDPTAKEAIVPLQDAIDILKKL